jgi:RNA polymerase-binding transcription factor DksA
MFARFVGYGFQNSRLVELMAESKAQEEDGSLESEQLGTREFGKSELLSSSVEGNDEELSLFLDKQKSKLLQFRDNLLDLMTGVSRDTLRSRAEDSEASAFGMHQADAGSDTYDRDFALNLLSQEQDALYEVEEALKRVDAGTYGVCEMSGKPIPQARLEAIPFARFTVECQTQIEKRQKAVRVRHLSSLFSVQPKMRGLKEKKTRSAIRKISCNPNGN